MHGGALLPRQPTVEALYGYGVVTTEVDFLRSGSTDVVASAGFVPCQPVAVASQRLLILIRDDEQSAPVDDDFLSSWLGLIRHAAYLAACQAACQTALALSATHRRRWDRPDDARTIGALIEFRCMAWIENGPFLAPAGNIAQHYVGPLDTPDHALALAIMEARSGGDFRRVQLG